MIVLGIDTATSATSVALLDTSTGDAVQRRDDPPAGARPRHTTRLLALVAAAMEAAGAGWDAIDRIAVGTGPGTFTGLRIGVATARALAAAREIELCGVSTLHALARPAGPAAAEAARDVVAVLDARRGELFAAGWPAGGVAAAAARPDPPPAALTPAALAGTLAGSCRPWLAVGDGALLAAESLAAAGVQVAPADSELHRVDARAHCRLAAELAPDAPGDVLPEYLRVPDAELTRVAALAHGGAR